MTLRLLPSVVAFTLLFAAAAETQVTKYVRYEASGRISYGILDGDTIRELSGDLFAAPKPTGRTVKLAAVKLLAPCEPKKVIAVGLNYKSHLGERPAATYPGLFAKMPTSIVGPDADIVYPEGAKNVHFEGELVVVIGKRAQKVAAADAGQYIFGVTAGNDVSERDWQKSDLQWFRAKASDTFGPMGPVLVTNVDYNSLKLIGRHNGKVVQETTTDLLIFSIDHIVSYVSRYVTLEPGDVIFTGTPGTTQAMKPGDTFEVEIVSVTTLRNTVVAAKGGAPAGER